MECQPCYSTPFRKNQRLSNPPSHLSVAYNWNSAIFAFSFSVQLIRQKIHSMSLSHYSTVSGLPCPVKVEGFNSKNYAISILWQTSTTGSPRGLCATTANTTIAAVTTADAMEGSAINVTSATSLTTYCATAYCIRV